MKTILVTGSNGQLGNELRKLSNVFKEFNFVFTDVGELDITDLAACEAFFSDTKPQFVINCAAYTAVDKAETDKHTAWKINVEAVGNLAKSSRQADAFLIHISTDYVFDGRSCIPYKETDLTSPQSEYGRGKVAGEQEALTHSKALVIRTSWLYSTFGNNFVKTMIRLGQERESLNVVFDQTGTPTYAADLASAIMQIIDKVNAGNKQFIPGIYHYSNEGVCSWYDFACAIMNLKGLNCKIKPIETKDFPTPAKRPSFGVLNKSKIKSVYDIEINHWRSSLQTMLNE
jgi:dTDP-4-dehydrorhamnose reductase